MEIAVISTYDWIKKHNNYGSIFQYYALQEHLQGLGHDAFWIRYDPILDEIYDDKLNERFRAKRLVSFPLKKLKYILRKDIMNEIAGCADQFALFVDKYINVSRFEYKSWKSLQKNPPKANLYITGSDQVWLGENEANYLKFVPKGKKKISYGASFGKNHLVEQNDFDSISKLISTIDKISVREKVGVDICKKSGRKDAVQVADPVLLHSRDTYVRLIKKETDQFELNEAEPYIFSYFLKSKKPSAVHW